MKLIIINGPCGVGKSTITAKLHQDIPLSFMLNIDDQRRLFSHYRERHKESGEASLSLAKVIVKTCFEMGHDVIIDKMLYDHSIIDSFYKIAEQYKAEVKEFIIWASKEVIMQRANERGWKEGGLLTPEKCEFFWEQINEIKDQRPNAIIIDTSNISEDEAYAKIRQLLN